MYKLIPYKEWSGVSYDGSKFLPQIPKIIVIHHTYKPESEAVGKSAVKNIREYHIKHSGYDDIAYHYIIDANGVIYKGRDDKHVGSHCIPNTDKIGICVIGNYDKEYLTPIAYDKLIELLANLCSEYDIDVYNIRGHRDYADKSCPGDNIYEILPEIRETVKEYLP